MRDWVKGQKTLAWVYFELNILTISTVIRFKINWRGKAIIGI